VTWPDEPTKYPKPTTNLTEWIPDSHVVAGAPPQASGMTPWGGCVGEMVGSVVEKENLSTPVPPPS
jgi:hypothetical protein